MVILEIPDVRFGSVFPKPVTNMITEVEAIINTRPLTYVYGDFLSGFTLTPAHFLTANLDTVIPFNIDDCEDVDYQLKEGFSTRVD